MRPFEYRRPADLAEAAGLLADASREAALLAGGHTLIPAMKARLRAPDMLVDLGAIPDLDKIERTGDRLTIGAMTRHATIAAHPLIRSTIPSLARAAELVGDPAVRARGTLGGAVANNDPAADYPAAVLALDALIETDRRTIAADGFFLAMFTTALEEGEILTRIAFRVPQAGAYAKYRHPASRYALAGVYVARFGGGVRVAVTGAGPSVFRWSAAEAALERSFSREAVAGLKPDPAELAGDIHASPEYRAQLAAVMLDRAVGQANRGD